MGPGTCEAPSLGLLQERGKAVRGPSMSTPMGPGEAFPSQARLELIMCQHPSEVPSSHPGSGWFSKAFTTRRHFFSFFLSPWETPASTLPFMGEVRGALPRASQHLYSLSVGLLRTAPSASPFGPFTLSMKVQWERVPLVLYSPSLVGLGPAERGPCGPLPSSYDMNGEADASFWWEVR